MEEQLHKFDKRKILNLMALRVNQSCTENAKEIVTHTHTHIRAGREVRKVPGSKCTSSKSRAALWQAHHKNMSDKKRRWRVGGGIETVKKRRREEMSRGKDGWGVDGFEPSGSKNQVDHYRT